MVALNSGEDETVLSRIKDYLSRDKDGRRRAVLELFLNGGLYETKDIDDYLREKNFDVKNKGTPAMVGLMGSKTGILSVDVTGDHNMYSIKEKYRQLVREALRETESS
ncbi:MAG: hypothetical protein A4E28_02410 [Methanocella sp. PtaU1.Bin125]|nr:MAG: hypothetical protein A4E28_02410 [Methanocella sp. PtaU1.Bin125]